MTGVSKKLHALTEIMNEIQDDRALKKFSEQVFGGVVPIRNREKYDRIVQATVTLLAAKLPEVFIVKSLFDAQDLGKDELWLRQNVVAPILKMSEQRAEQRTDKEANIGTSLRLALSYAAVNDARSGPSDELREKAMTDGMEKVGTEAMIDVMRFLSDPHMYELTPETVRLAAALTRAIEMRARDLSSAQNDETIEDIQVDEHGKTCVILNGPFGPRTFSDGYHEDNDFGM